MMIDRLMCQRLYFVICLVLNTMIPSAFANMPADPRPFRLEQPNGEWVRVRAHGDAEFHYLTDENGYTVTKEKGYIVYAKKNEETGKLESTGKRVGKVHPSKLGIQKKLLPSRKMIEESCGEFCQEPLEDHQEQRRNLMESTKNGVLNNLVILICFDDHDISSQPSQKDFDILFNSEGVDDLRNANNVQIARTGSIKDVMLTSSYGKLKIESHVHPWIKVSKPESYYTNGNSGLSTRLHEAMEEALDMMDKNGFDFSEFDQNRDGNIDSITFLHSGFGAEFGGVDCHGKTETGRVWSHKWSMTRWNSQLKRNNSQVSVTRYHISPAKWGTCGNKITRIGVIAHEIGHFLGLEDHYDGKVGVGIANYGLMGNAWGFDFSQEYPPIMSPYNKIKLGWLEPIVISESKKYTIPSSADNPIVYKIEEGFPEGEYLLIENRQPKLHDQKMPQGGILIWHVDEKADTEREGFPDQIGWPQNGNHYKVALLQADGGYDLEQGNDHGDSKDAFHADGVHSIGPTGTSTGKAFPNTNCYQDGKVAPTGHIISEISTSSDIMTFRLSKQDNLSTEVSTFFDGGNGQAGVMFDVVPKQDLSIHSMDIHTSSTDSINVEIWSKTGSLDGSERKSEDWTYRGKTTVKGKGAGMRTTVTGFDEMNLKKGVKSALYVTIDDRLMLYSNNLGGRTHDLAADSKHLSILVGVGKKYKFSTTIPNRIWNGTLRYRLE